MSLYVRWLSNTHLTKMQCNSIVSSINETFISCIKKEKTMADTNHIILGVHITNRTKHVSSVQDLLTKYGCNVKTRLGLHHVASDFCSASGLLILEMAGDPAICYELMDELASVEGVEVQKMVFKND